LKVHGIASGTLDRIVRQSYNQTILLIQEEFTPVRREATRDKVSAALRDAILSGRLSVGQRLPEIELTRQFQVSRAAIRESLQQLAHEGLVVLNSHRGAQVVDLSPEEIDEVISVRLLLEPEAVRSARKRMTDDEREQLLAAGRKVEAARQAPQEFVRYDRAFHELLWSFSQNATLHRHLTLLLSPLFSMGTILRRVGAIAEDGATVRVPGDHEELARLITEGQEAEALAAIREHITENWSRTKAAVDQLHVQKRAPVRKTSR
jgi:DNA-binding GntR family transcriptional regulator